MTRDFYFFADKKKSRRKVKITMWIGDAGSDGFREGTRCHEFNKVPRCFGMVVRRWHSLAMLDQPGFDGFVDDKVHDCLAYANVRGRDALVKAQESLKNVSIER